VCWTIRYLCSLGRLGGYLRDLDTDFHSLLEFISFAFIAV
jgi:hypothetical protein